MANNYTALVQDIQDFTENDATEFTDNIALIIDLAELRLRKDLGLIKGFRGTGSTTASTKSVTIPTTDTVVSIQFVKSTPSGGTQLTLIQKDESFIESFWTDATSTGTPRYYAQINDTTIAVAPTPSASTTFDFIYTLQLAPLVATTNETNYLTDNYYDALLYASLISSVAFMKEEPQEFQVWNTKYQEAMIRGQAEEKRIHQDIDRRRN